MEENTFEGASLPWLPGRVSKLCTNITYGYIIRSMENIKELRRQLRLTQKRLAEELGVTLATVGRWECGLREPSPLAVRAMELLLEVERLKRQRSEVKE